MRGIPPSGFGHLMQPTSDAALTWYLNRLLIFASLIFFLFSREAKFGEFRLTRSLQVVCWLPVGVWR